jgi:hypothetical protein
VSDQKILTTPQQTLPRRFVNDESVLAVYSDLTVTADLGDALIVQFFQTQLGVPDEKNLITDAKAVLQARVILSPAHAKLLHSSLGQTLDRRPKTT